MLPWLSACALITIGTVYPKALGAIGLTPKAKYDRICVGSGTCTTGLPAPSNYVATALIFGPLALVSDTAKFGKTADLIAWGILLGMLLNLIDPKDPLNPNTPGAVVNPSLKYPQGPAISGPASPTAA